MKPERKNKLTRKVTVRFTDDEYTKIQMAFRSTVLRQLSSYFRNVMLEKPVTIYTRNRSIDDMMAEIILLRTELKAIGNNFNQAVKKLHTMDDDFEIKTWARVNENHKQILFKKIDEINFKIAQLDSQWAHE
jgi:hypothetical protein